MKAVKLLDKATARAARDHAVQLHKRADIAKLYAAAARNQLHRAAARQKKRSAQLRQWASEFALAGPETGIRQSVEQK